jgi:hypothetical protein
VTLLAPRQLPYAPFELRASHHPILGQFCPLVNGVRSTGRRLLDHRHKFRFDNSSIGRDQPKPVHLGRGDDSPVCRVPQTAAHGGEFGGNLDVDGDNVESGPRPKGAEKFLGWDPQPGAAFAGQHGDFEQGDGAQRQRFASPNGAAEHA